MTETARWCARCTHACMHAWPAVRTCTTGPRRRCLLDRRNLSEGEHVVDDSDAADMAWPSMPSGAERHRQHSQRLPAVGEQPGRRPLRALPRYTRMHARANAHARAQARTRGGVPGRAQAPPEATAAAATTVQRRRSSRHATAVWGTITFTPFGTW